LSASKLHLVFTTNWNNFWHPFAIRGFVSDSWAFLLKFANKIANIKHKNLTVYNTV